MGLGKHMTVRQTYFINEDAHLDALPMSWAEKHFRPATAELCQSWQYEAGETAHLPA